MARFLGLMFLTLALAEAFADERGSTLNLDNGELCFGSSQCRSRCCQRTSGQHLAHCMVKAAENQECSLKNLYAVYYKCPCEKGLKCEADRTIVGSITNTDFGICRDPAKK